MSSLASSCFANHSGPVSRFGRSHIGGPDPLAEGLARDEAVREADTVLVTIPNQLGVDYNAALLGNIVKHVFGQD